jgi:preprotein translocase subunit SecY
VSIPQSGELKNSYIPIKLNQGGIMPLVFSSTIATFLYYPLQIFANSSFGLSLGFMPALMVGYSFVLNIVLVVFFSGFYALLVLKPNDISQNLAKMAYSIPGVRQGNQTTQFLKQTVSRLAFMGGLFLAFLAFFPIYLGISFSSIFLKT